jgi:hypothetical protein
MIAKYPFGSLILFLLCIVPMRAAEAASFDWRWTNRSGKLVHVQIYANGRNNIWPATEQHWIVPSDRKFYTNRISCKRGEKICYGAWIADQPDLYWGVGKGGQQNCSNCCFVCDGQQSSMLSFDPGPVVASPPKTPAIRKEEWIAEGGDAAVLIGALTIETGAERGLITFGNGASLPLERVNNAEEIWKVTPPQSPIVRRGERLCTDDITYIGITRNGMDRMMKIFNTPDQPAGIGGILPSPGSCALVPMFEKSAYQKLKQ